MNWLDLAILSLVVYRVTRFTQLDSLIKEPRDWLARKLLKPPTYREDGQEWPFNPWRRKALEWLTCPFCVSVWAAAGAWWFWHWWGDTLFGQFMLGWLAVSGGAMVVYKFIDPPHPPQPCVPVKPCE